MIRLMKLGGIALSPQARSLMSHEMSKVFPRQINFPFVVFLEAPLLGQHRLRYGDRTHFSTFRNRKNAGPFLLNLQSRIEYNQVYKSKFVIIGILLMIAVFIENMIGGHP